MESQAILERALELHEERLSALPNVVGLGIVSEPDHDRSAVAVYVTEKVPLGELKPAERIPKRLSAKVGRRRRWVPVSVIEQGIVKLE